MKKLLITFFLVLFVSSLALADAFLPTKLQLTLPETVNYAFDGSVLEIPINVDGTDARTWFFVYTRGKGDEIGEVQNGYLGWHYVNGIDTCVFMSVPTDYTVGNHMINWSGLDSDGGSVLPDDYSYYVFAYDYTTPPESQQSVNGSMYFIKENGILVKELDEAGNYVDNPIFSAIDNDGIVRKWVVGYDPLDDTLLETCDLQVHPDFRYQIPRPVSPKFTDHSLVHFCESNKDALIVTLRRANWVPNDLAERDPDWGLESAECFRNCLGPIDDGNYLYWGKSDVYSSDVCTNSYISDYEGDFVASFQNDFWIKPDEFALGAACLQGGPRWHTSKDGKSLIVQATYFTLHALANPLRYIDSGDYPDFTNCFNQNGDYVLDHSWDPAFPTPWLTFTEDAPWTNSCYTDDNYFSVADCRGMGAVSFALLAPDWTGVGYCAFAGEPGGIDRKIAIIQSGSAYDGMYVSGNGVTGLGYCGHDSFMGLLSSGVAVADAAPSAFAVEQNSPNPANPTTTISFTLPEAGTVTVEVFNVAGQKVDTLVNDFMDSGKHSLVWDGSTVSTGVYFYTVTSNEFSKTMKMTLLK